MNDIEETGGARIGMAHATWPFATLTVNKNMLRLNASIIGNLYFRPSDIVSIEPSSLFSGVGIKINHRVEKYNSKVVFLTSGAGRLISQIADTGFLNNTSPIPPDVEAEIEKYQSEGSFPVKWSAVIVFGLVWNLLILGDWFGYFGSHKNIPFGVGEQAALAFAFLFALMLLISEPFRGLVLKKGRTVSDVKLFLFFLMLITGIIFAITMLIRTYS